MATPTFNENITPDDNIRALIQEQATSGSTAARPNGLQPFPVLIAKAAFNAEQKAQQAIGGVSPAQAAALEPKTEYKDASFTAVVGRSYNANEIGTPLIVTSPAGTEGASFNVFVQGGTVNVGGVNYTDGQTIKAHYVGGGWEYNVYISDAASTADLAAATQFIALNNGGTVTWYDLTAAPDNWQSSNATLEAVYGGSKLATIGNYAFDNCAALASVSLPAAASLGDYAFEGCTALTSVSMPVATTIGASAFYGGYLTSVSLPVAATIGDYAFSYCALTSVSLPVAANIGDYAFENCNVLASVSLPVATTIGSYAFENCSALASVSLPSATSIGEYAFESCDALTSVSMPVATSIGEYAFSYGTLLASVTLPSATTIGDFAFDGCTVLSSVSLPAATTIGIDTFRNCTALASVSLPSAMSIGDYAFENCTALASVSLPSAATIGDYAFQSCTSLTSGVYLNAPLAGLDADALTGSSITTIHLRPAPNTPAGWSAGAGQTINGKSGITVVFDWTTFPNLP